MPTPEEIAFRKTQLVEITFDLGTPHLFIPAGGMSHLLTIEPENVAFRASAGEIPVTFKLFPK